MQTWDELRADLLAVGFVEILVLELSCPATCGDWRLGILTDSEFRPRCPKCNEPCDAAILGRGLCRCRTLEPRCVSPALRPSLKIHEEFVLSRASRGPGRRWQGRKFLEAAKAELNELLPSLTLKTRIFEAARPKPRAPRPTRAEMQQRIRLVAELLAQGRTHREIAEQTGLDPLGLKVLVCRRKKELQAAVSELETMGSDALETEIVAAVAR